MDLDIQSYSLGHLGIVAGIFYAGPLTRFIDMVQLSCSIKSLCK